MSTRAGSRSARGAHHRVLAAPTFEAAEDQLTAALVGARAARDVDAATTTETWRGLVRVRRGLVAGALADLELVVARAASGGVPAPEGALAGLLECHLARGDLWRAERVVAPLERAEVTTGPAGALAQHARGDLAGAGRDHTAAWQHYLAAGRALGTLVDDPAVLPWRLGAAVTAVHLGLRPDAVALVETHRDLALADGRASVVAAALRAEGTISAPGRRQELLEEALLHADPCDTPRLASQVATDLAAHLVLGGGSTERACALLRSAATLARGAGLRPTAERAERLQRMLGETPATQPPTRADRLSGLQALLARLAADGSTDEEISAALLLDVEVVRREVREACRLLHVRVRHRIAGALPLPPGVVPRPRGTGAGPGSGTAGGRAVAQTAGSET